MSRPVNQSWAERYLSPLLRYSATCGLSKSQRSSKSAFYEEKSCGIAVADKISLKRYRYLQPSKLQRTAIFTAKIKASVFYEAISVKPNSNYFKKTFSLEYLGLFDVSYLFIH